MDTTRRDFLGKVAINAAVFGAMPLSLDLSSLSATTLSPQQGEKWDVTWVNRLTGKHKALFDVPEVESGYGVWRATIWQRQYQDVLGIAPKELSAAVVLRHAGQRFRIVWSAGDEVRRVQAWTGTDWTPANSQEIQARFLTFKDSIEILDEALGELVRMFAEKIAAQSPAARERLGGELTSIRDTANALLEGVHRLEKLIVQAGEAPRPRGGGAAGAPTARRSARIAGDSGSRRCTRRRVVARVGRHLGW